jgi:hypothetical protein
MNKFMIDILLQGIDSETRINLLPKEQEIIKEWELNETLLGSYIKAEPAGIYFVLASPNPDGYINCLLQALKHGRNRYWPVWKPGYIQLLLPLIGLIILFALISLIGLFKKLSSGKIKEEFIFPVTIVS